jgi:hypothetical protein
MDRRTMRESLFHEYRDWLMPLADFVEQMTAILNAIPAEHREKAVFEVDVEDDYYGGSSSVSTNVYYDRKETDEEVAKREADAQRSAEEARRHNELRERQIYEQLKRKFGHDIGDIPLDEG